MSVPTELVGKRVGNNRIELISLLGEGSYGAVYHGIFHRGLRTPKHCAVKVQRSSIDERQRVFLQRELELHQRVSEGDGIVPLYETFKEGEYTFIVMKFCADGDLWTSINRGRFLGNDALIKDVFTQVLDATEYCHSRSVYHRDIKPENILLCNGGHKALLADFGLATNEPMSKENRAGSPWYMSPECWGPFPSLVEEPYSTAPNDVWSLGILLINLTCARHAPWKHAHQMDRFFHDFTRQPNLLRLFVPLSPQVHDILARIFVPSSGARISIKDLRVAIKDVKSFNIPSSCRREYHKYQRAVWKTAVGPSPSRPLSIKVIRPPPVAPEESELNDASKLNTLVGSGHGPSTSVIDHDTTAVDNSHQAWPSRGNSRSLPALPHSSSSSSSVDSDGPTTPSMSPTVPDIEVLDTVDLDQSKDHGPEPIVVMKPLPPTPKTMETPLTISPGTWQGVLEIIRAI